MRSVGRELPRVDGFEKVTGRATYIADFRLPDMAFGAVVRSPHPRARVRGIDASAAISMPGVLVVLTPADVAEFPKVRLFADSPAIQQILTSTPQFVGDAVAAVVAETEEEARIAADSVIVDYEEMPACLTIEDALAADPPLHEDVPDNLAGPVVEFRRGDPDAAFRTCDNVHQDTFTTQRQSAQTIEPLACVCVWGESGYLEVWTHLDSMFHFRDELAAALALQSETVIVRPAPTLGATFGLKNSLIASLEPLCAVMSKTSGRPVKLALSPEESIYTTVSRHRARIQLTTGLDSEGNILARRAEVVLDSGAYGWGYVVALSMLGKWITLYPTENLDFVARSVYTNHISGGAYRAVGTVQIHFAMESQMDDISLKLSLDPVEFRRRNLVRAGEFLPKGTKIRSLGVDSCLNEGSRVFGWPHTSEQQERSSKNGELVSRGVGMAVGMHHAGLTGLIPTPEGSSCIAEVTEGGKVVITVGVVEKGQGAITTLVLVAAEELGIDPKGVTLRNPGTAGVPLDFSGAEASRTTYVIGRAVADAARQIRGEMEKRGCGLADLEGLKVEGDFSPVDQDPLPTIAAHFCEVEVDNCTGLVTVLRYVAAQDVGLAINPLGCLGQVEGGIHHGIGYALCEELLYEGGQPQNANFMGYKVLMATDMPEIEVVLVEEPDPDGGPYGAKGVGTPVMPAIAPAIANAVRDAIGSRISDLPLTPEKVLKAMQMDRTSGYAGRNWTSD